MNDRENKSEGEGEWGTDGEPHAGIENAAESATSVKRDKQNKTKNGAMKNI